VDLAVVDVSFISLSLVLEHAVRFLKAGGRVLALIKPQFEAGREQVGRGGRVSDSEVHEQVLQKVNAAGERLGLRLEGQMASPLAGKKSGNREYLGLWRREAPASRGAAG